ncbi:hypothetical protein [Mucilaginibacter celer]|uniref:Right-handed parallel beta-helix repeat-containing protein n=1 Tax=Mucilaginibacter celer TaxID=2305508 RepID=A0A494VZ33_9SPHI|nr:hypothetical protein [Mucilaginibacter celer]AYL96252.1 hypothetical protein HYN43_013540 [Mucilaginibacter celer]
MKMKKSLLLAAFVLVFASVSNAKSWRVNNNGFSANFTSLAAAVADNNVLSGDILYVEGSAKGYESITVNKKLTIIGPGYWLSQNPNTTTNVLSVAIPYVQFGEGSDGSTLMGVQITSSSGISIQANSITIKRCLINQWGIYIGYNISDIKILQNFFANPSNYTGYNAINYSSSAFATDVVFNNNIVQTELVLDYNYSLLECRNNVFSMPARGTNAVLKMITGTFQNNIIINSNAVVDINNKSNRNASYNVSASANNQFGTANNNIVVTSILSLFVTGATSNDAAYQLATGSAASANGSDGTDRGPFGGAAESNRYTLSGLPPVPVIYDINTTGVTTTTTLPVTIKARVIK